MAKLIILHNGQQIGDYELNAGQEYFAGRGSQSQFQLPNVKGVSRQHIRFTQIDGIWCVEQVSKYGSIVYEGQTSSKLELRGSIQFAVPPFDFQFIDEQMNTADKTSQSAPHAATRTLQITHEDVPLPDDPFPLEEHVAPPPAATTFNAEEDSSDATKIMSLKAVPFLVVKNLKTRTEDVLKLGEGTTWTAGRHPVCPIYIKDSAISRSHFHLHLENGKYFITDHGSSNSTKLNGEKIQPQVAAELHSGDVLKIRHVEILFELRDPNYQNQLALIPNNLVDSDLDSDEFQDSDMHAANPDRDYVSNSEYHYPTSANNQMAPQVLRIPPSQPAINPLQMLFANKVRVALVAGILLILFSVIFGGNDDQKSGSQNNGSTSPGGSTNPNDIKPVQLTAEQTTQLRDTLNLAKRHYQMQKYELCLEQIERIKLTTPYFEESKQIENYCIQGLEIQRVNHENEQREQKQLDAQNKIRAIVEGCRATLKPTMTKIEMETCLQEAFALNPEDSDATQLLLLVEEQENSKRAEYQKLIDFKKRKSQGKQLYEQAEKAYNNEQWKESLRLFKAFRNGNYPGLNLEQDLATRKIASIENAINQDINQQISGCQSNMQNGNLRAAYIACSKVLKENPNNSEAFTMKRKVLAQMNKEMKGLYEDSVLEEGLGNIESAKEKWQQIIDKSVPDNDYYKKARSKLKKYGIEF